MGSSIQGILAGAFFTLLGAAILWWGLRARNTVRAQVGAAQRWPEAMAVIEAADIYETRNGCTPRIKYRFESGGRSFTGTRLRFGNVTTRFKPAARAMLAPYHAGSQIRVRYNPHDPRDNVVELRDTSAGFLWIAGIGALTIMMAMVFFVLAVSG